MADPISRRDFLEVTTGAGAFATVGSTFDGPWVGTLQGQQPEPASTNASTGWFDKPMRWAQLTLVENDPGRFDPEFWIDYFKRLRADAVCLSAGGIVAYYPTDVPLHHRSKFLGRHRSVRRCCSTDAARPACIVIARTDPHAARDEVRAAHPDWIAVSANGQPTRHWANPELWITCALGPYNFEFMDRGAPRDRVEVQGRRHLRQPLGEPERLLLRALPGESSRRRPASTIRARPTRAIPTRRQLLEWRKARLTELWKHWDATIRAANPEARVIPNGPPDLKTAGDLAPIQFSDTQARSGAPSAVGSRPSRERVSIGHGPPADWRHLQRRARGALSLEGLRAERARSPAVGRRGHGERHAPVGDEVLRRPLRSTLAAHGRAHLPVARPPRALPAQRGAARARRDAVLRTDGLVPRRRGAGRPGADHVLGMYHALVESRVPFELVHEAFLTPDRLAPFKLLILADAAALSDAQCAAIRDFVARGGSLLATFASSLYDERGRRRDNFGLADVFGVSFGGRIDGPMQNSYLSLDADPATGRRHPILDGLEDTPRIINGVFRLQVTPTIPFPSPVTLIPTYPDLPMEDVYPRVPHTDIREVYLRDLGTEPRRLRALGHRSDVLGRHGGRSRPPLAESLRLDGERAAAGRGDRSGAHRRHRVASARRR